MKEYLIVAPLMEVFKLSLKDHYKNDVVQIKGSRPLVGKTSHIERVLI